MRPTIILAMPYFYGFDKMIAANLRYCGFDVINLCYDERRTVYPNLRTRLIALYRKHICHDLDYRKRLRYWQYHDDIQQKLSSLTQGKAHYALCINAHHYPHHLIQTIREHSQYCVAYQWDYIDRYPVILDYVHYFDQFFVFENNDVQRYPQYHFQAATNFYFDAFLSEHSDIETNKGLYYLGFYLPNRANTIQRFLNMARAQNVPLAFYIQGGKEARAAFGEDGVQYFDSQNSVNYQQNIQNIHRYQAIVDFVAPEHSGLSFRIFEALAYRKKLITTNPHVADYPFYHQDNILIWQDDQDVDLAAFLAKPYVPIDDDLVRYYGFSAWIGRILAK